MRQSTAWAGGCALAAMAVAGIAAARAPATDPSAAATSIERGRYLVASIGCGDCHTPGAIAGSPDAARTLSGSEFGWKGPWGISYPSNLTSHETGLAAWTEQDIVRALREGVRADGTRLRPPMPWPAFSNLTDQDAYAIAAYLKTLPPVAHQEPPPLAPGQPDPQGGSIISIPPPPAWDVPPRPAGG